MVPITAPTLGGVTYAGGASGAGLTLRLGNSSGAAGQFPVWGTTNLSFRLASGRNWDIRRKTSGSHQFTDVQATNKPARFYKMTSL